MMLFAQLAISFEPAFAYPGERFAVVAPAQAMVSADGISFVQSGGRWLGVAPSAPTTIFATLGQAGQFSDATSKTFPIATSQHYRVGKMEVVLLQGGAYAAVFDGKRYADLVAFDLAARSAPQRGRDFRVDYVYAGPGRLSLSGTAGGVLRAVVTVTPGNVEITYATLFDLSGSIQVLGQEFTVPQSSPGTVGSLSYPF